MARAKTRKKAEPQEPEPTMGTTIIFPKSTHKAVRIAAVTEGISMSRWVVRAVEDALEDV